ncbi:tRNA glutamyl-Q(34) synthetase GluQRS [Sphingomonas sp. H160509]|uniref:tRNA glutamyl-Q(34) synthetase GluQRS n=1 Tax=Sphingomonas sp. H160509 TaxID=2955313 RepID=UPI002098327C|nr:tRNA glutamyl-Q(34) synthetase GluQRS [Sphingomonas sp. H160509]MDD1451564.1 tRNA glutamyl-Q(34) synthetase GluQRS [Sphingomonas sp. H160509]
MLSDGPVVTRFAPSPTGRLHLGHAVSAIRAHDYARERGGRFLLRIEDIDGTRSRPEFVAGILEDLAWLGLRWDSLVFQSERLATYDLALEQLKARALVYPCFCTRAEIAASASAPQGDVGPVYPGTCRHLSAEEVAARGIWRIAGGSIWRRLWRLPACLRGMMRLPGPSWRIRWRRGDVVLARKDAPASYHLAVTLDDAAQGVTDVVRGVDLFAATDVHRVLQALLGLGVPAYRHHPLVVDAAGRRLAKREGAVSLAEMRAAGGGWGGVGGSGTEWGDRGCLAVLIVNVRVSRKVC